MGKNFSALETEKKYRSDSTVQLHFIIFLNCEVLSLQNWKLETRTTNSKSAVYSRIFRELNSNLNWESEYAVFLIFDADV